MEREKIHETLKEICESAGGKIRKSLGLYKGQLRDQLLCEFPDETKAYFLDDGVDFIVNVLTPEKTAIALAKVPIVKCERRKLANYVELSCMTEYTEVVINSAPSGAEIKIRTIGDDGTYTDYIQIIRAGK